MSSPAGALSTASAPVTATMRTNGRQPTTTLQRRAAAHSRRELCRRSSRTAARAWRPRSVT